MQGGLLPHTPLGSEQFPSKAPSEDSSRQGGGKMLRLEGQETKRAISPLKQLSLKKRLGCVIIVPRSPSQTLRVSWLPRETPRCFCSGVIMTGNIKSGESCIDSLIWNIMD